MRDNSASKPEILNTFCLQIVQSMTFSHAQPRNVLHRNDCRGYFKSHFLQDYGPVQAGTGRSIEWEIEQTLDSKFHLYISKDFSFDASDW